jgi:hypothetical protein
MKTTWDIIKEGTGKIHVTEQMLSLLITDEKTKHPKKLADLSNTFFLSFSF